MPPAETRSTGPSLEVDEIAALRDLARSLARTAGAHALQLRRQELAVVSTKSTSFDVATNADYACEQLLRRGIALARPDDGILGEEGARVVGTSGFTWVLDPIDGTTNFLYGLPHWAVSVAVVTGDPEDPRRWELIASSVYMPDLDSQYDAGLGIGARRDGNRINRPEAGLPGTIEEPSAALVAVGFHYDPRARREQAQIAARWSDQIRDLRDHGATSLELCFVADGSLDGYWEERVAPWDLAGGLLIAREAGCSVIWRYRRSATGLIEEGLVVCGTELLARSLATMVG